MADRRTRREQARRARKKARKDRATSSRRRGRSHGTAAGARWPFIEAWIGEDWHDPLAILPGFGIRRHDDGRAVWFSLRVDLSDGTLVDATSDIGSEDEARRALVALAEDAPMRSTVPSTLAQLFEAARARTAEEPPSTADIAQLLEDQDPVGADLDIAFGFDTPTDPGQPTRRPGLMSRIIARLLGRPTDG